MASRKISPERFAARQRVRLRARYLAFSGVVTTNLLPDRLTIAQPDVQRSLPKVLTCNAVAILSAAGFTSSTPIPKILT